MRVTSIQWHQNASFPSKSQLFKSKQSTESWICVSFLKVCWYRLPKIIKISPCLLKLQLAKVGAFFSDTMYRRSFTWLFTWCGHTRRRISSGRPADVAKRASQIKCDPRRSPSSFIVPYQASLEMNVKWHRKHSLHLIGSNGRSLFHKRKPSEGSVYNAA